jgi:hypothetical protein
MSTQSARSRFDTTRPQRKRRKIQDPIRNMVIASVQHHLLPEPVKPALHPLPDSVEDVSAVAVDEAETVIRVRLRNGQVRAFSVKVREVMQ